MSTTTIVRRIASPQALLVWAALLAALVVQPGESGSVDTARRLQTTHWLWTSAPAVLPADYPEFGLKGRNNEIYPWYGIGQSLVMLPPDIATAALIRAVPKLRRFEELNALIVTYTVSPILCVLAVLMTFRFLRLLHFTENESVAGALALLLGTTFLHYTQNMMENNLMLLLTVTGLYLHFKWLRTGSTLALAGGSAALGANLLVRLTTGLNVIAVAPIIALCLGANGWRQAVLRLRDYAIALVSSCAFFLAIARAYHFYRFGECCNTYIDIYARQQHQLNPLLPAAFPYTTPFSHGFWGALITPEKSIFLFDPLLILLVILVITAWKQFSEEIRAYVVSLTVILIAYIAFHARFDFWSGDVAWGDRYLSTPVQLLAMMSVPLLLRHWAELAQVVRAAGLAILAAAVAVQAASVALWYPLEFRQMTFLGHPTFVVGLRFRNIAAMALDKMAAWHLTNNLTQDNFRATGFYFYPFLLMRRHADLPAWSTVLLAGGWIALVGGLVWVLFVIGSRARTGWATGSAGEPARQSGIRGEHSSTVLLQKRGV